MVWWSLACAGHGLATGVLDLGGEPPDAGAWPKAVPSRRGPRPSPSGSRHVNERQPWAWSMAAVGRRGDCSAGHRAWCCAVRPWPWVFYLSGAVGLLWTVWWLWEYYPPAQHPRLSAEERREIQEVLVPLPRSRASVSWWRLLVLPQVWGMVLGKCFCDAVWFTYVGWLPKYLCRHARLYKRADGLRGLDSLCRIRRGESSSEAGSPAACCSADTR